MTEKYKEIENWTEADLQNLPEQETDILEYKSSVISDKELRREIGNAASAFLNSNGGVFLAGIEDSTGKIDGGISEKVGKQPRSDWVHHILAEVEPPGQYFVKSISPDPGSPFIKPGNIVLAISFPGSSLAPHMSPDNRYYIRAGASTKPAGHFLVEAIKAYKAKVNPMLSVVFRWSPVDSSKLQIIVLALNDAPALNVSLSFDPLSSIEKTYLKKMTGEERFPLRVPVIDKRNPFIMEFWRMHKPLWNEGNRILLTYEDTTGKGFTHNQEFDLERNMDSRNSNTPHEEVLKGINNLAGKMDSLIDLLTKGSPYRS